MRTCIPPGFALDLNIAKRSSWLSRASVHGDLPSVKYYLEHGAFISAKQDSLILAAAEGHLDIVKELLRQGARPSAFGTMDENGLMKASQNGHVDVVRSDENYE